MYSVKATSIPLSSNHTDSQVSDTFAPMQQSNNGVTFHILRMIPRYLRLDTWASEQQETLRAEIKTLVGL